MKDWNGSIKGHFSKNNYVVFSVLIITIILIFTIDPDAMFIHDGHEDEMDSRVRILTHDWHFSNDRMLISAATDGSLHAWQFNANTD